MRPRSLLSPEYCYSAHPRLWKAVEVPLGLLEAYASVVSTFLLGSITRARVIEKEDDEQAGGE